MSRARALVVLIAVAALAAALLAGLDSATRERIATNEAQRLVLSIQAVLPPGFDNEPHRDQALVSAPEALGTDEALPVFRARRGGEPAGLAMTVGWCPARTAARVASSCSGQAPVRITMVSGAGMVLGSKRMARPRRSMRMEQVPSCSIRSRQG